MIRGYSSLVRSAVVSAPPGRYEDNPFQFFPLVTLSNHLKCTIESDSSWSFLKVRSRVTPWCPRRDSIGTAGQTDTIVGLVLARGREMPCSTKVELYGAHARQGKETVYLVGNRKELVGRHGRWSPALVMGVGLTAVVVRTHLNKDNDHDCSNRKLIKCLT